MKLEEGKTYYSYSKNLGLLEFEYINTEFNKLKFKDKFNSIISMDKQKIDQLRPNIDEAYLKAFLDDRNLYMREIVKYEDGIKKTKDKLNKLNKQFGYLKNIYPEEFL